jgi:hypothetical protein
MDVDLSFDEIEQNLNTGNYDINDISKMNKYNIVKYCIIIDIQFMIFDDMTNDNFNFTSTDIAYTSGNTFVNNENNYLQIANIVKALFPLRKELYKLIATIFTEDDYQELRNAGFDEYSRRIQ